jgi:hypothetical protein
VESLYDPVKWLAEGRAFVERARGGTISDEYMSEDVELAYDVTAWPQSWLAADVLTYDLGSGLEAGVGMVLNAEHEITARPEGDVDALLAAGDLEGAWRACFAPELADVIEAREAAAPIEKIKEPKKKSELEKAWATAACTLSPRSAFAGTWPSKWKDAQRRMRVLYARPRSPLFAAAAIAFANREDVGYTSISAQTFWQSMCWFIAEQADVRQLAALEALERRVCAIEERKELYATPALRAVTPRALSEKTRAAIAALVVEKPAPRATLSLTSAEERGVAADLLLEEGDPRGELIVVQRTIAATGATPELRKRLKQLLAKHGKAWCPSMIARDTCVFRDGVPVAGHMQFFSDAELASFASAKALATFETLVIPGAAMGPIEPSTIADVVRSLPALRHVITTDEAALALARGAPTSVEHLTIEGSRALPRNRPGLPKLRRVDAPSAQPVDVFGCNDPGEWHRLRRTGKHVAVVFGDLDYLDGDGWELWAEGKTVTAKPRGGARAKSLAATLARVASWDGVRELRVPENFATIEIEDVVVTPIAAVDPERFGTSVLWSKSRR